MDSVKSKVISELFFAPSVVLPFVGGISAALLSWSAGGVDSLSAAAAVGILGGIGWMVTRIIFRIESITEQVLQHQVQLQIEAEKEQLDELMRELHGDSDPRTQNYLSLLRSLRDDFWILTSRPGIQQRSELLREKVGEVFDAAVGQLKETLRLARLAESLSGEGRQKVQADRESSMAEIKHTIDQLRATIEQFREIAPDQARINLKSMREELEASIRVAQRTEQRMREMESLTSSSLTSVPNPLTQSDTPEPESGQTKTNIPNQPSSFIRE